MCMCVCVRAREGRQGVGDQHDVTPWGKVKISDVSMGWCAYTWMYVEDTAYVMVSKCTQLCTV